MSQFRIIMLLLVLLSSGAGAQVWTDLMSFQDVSSAVNDIVCGDDGTYYLGGACYDSFPLLGRILPSAGRFDCFIAHVDSAGTIMNFVTFGDVGVDCIYELDLQDDGILSATGSFQNTLQFGEISVTAPATRSFFLASFNRDASLRWIRTADAHDGIAVASNQRGHLAATGHFSEQASFKETETLRSRGENDIFLTLFDEDGTVKWSESIGSRFTDYTIDVTFSDSDELYLIGSFTDTLFLKNETIPYNGTKEMFFLAKFDTLGTLHWKQTIYTDGGYASSIITDATGNVYVTGIFKGLMEVDTLTAPADDEFDLFLVKFSAEGTLRWVAHSPLAIGRDLARGPGNSVFISGSFKMATSFGSFNLEAHNIEDIFIANFSGEGDCNWVIAAGGCRTTSLNTMAASDQNLYISGYVDMAGCMHSCPITMDGHQEIFDVDAVGSTYLAVADYTREPGGIIRPVTKSPRFTIGRSSPEMLFDLKGRQLSRRYFGIGSKESVPDNNHRNREKPFASQITIGETSATYLYSTGF